MDEDALCAGDAVEFLLGGRPVQGILTSDGIVIMQFVQGGWRPRWLPSGYVKDIAIARVRKPSMPLWYSRGDISSEEQEQLISVVKDKALAFGDFTLKSGKKSHYYLDCRLVTLDPMGNYLIASNVLRKLGDTIVAVGGPSIGADPIVGGVVNLSHLIGRNLRGFMIRKEPKDHGTMKLVEGPVKSGDKVAIVEDVTTTGQSTITAMEAARDFGLDVACCITVVDRLQGAAEAVQANAAAHNDYSLQFLSLMTIEDLGLPKVRSEDTGHLSS